MKIGDYVRTKHLGGSIEKIIKIIPKGKIGDLVERYVTDISEKYMQSITREQIIKSSPNIIELIEEGDILKIEEIKGIYTICEVEIFREPYEEYTFLGVRLDNRPFPRKLYELNIKSIVTKEQFESMEYKVGGQDV